MNNEKVQCYEDVIFKNQTCWLSINKKALNSHQTLFFIKECKGGGIGAAGAAMAAQLFSSNMDHALWPRLNWLSIRAARYGTDHKQWIDGAAANDTC